MKLSRLLPFELLHQTFGNAKKLHLLSANRMRTKVNTR